MNLKAPQTNERDEAFWSYSLLKEVQEGDIIYHYDGNSQAIVARSQAVGIPWEDTLVWAARGSSARSAKVVPRGRPGWYLGLERYEILPNPILLQDIRHKSQALIEIKSSLEHQLGNPLYLPFEVSPNRPLRPMQGYLFKLPRAFLQLFGLDKHSFANARARMTPTIQVATVTIGTTYRAADEEITSAERDPFAVDPAIVDRGLHGHAITQNALAAHLRLLGLEPRSPEYNEPNFDLAWQDGATIFVAEVKSLTDFNEEKQLRLGLGQVLRYAHCLRRCGKVVPVLVVERAPADAGWNELCNQLGVVLLWPERFSECIVKESS
jgi:hypothetical protein